MALDNRSVVIIILNWNGRQLLPLTLPALKAVEYSPYRVIIADNGSDDDSLKYVKEHYPDLSVIDLSQNLGYSRGLNEAVDRLSAQEDILVLLNNDVIVRPDWLAQLVAPFEDDRVGITGPKLLFPDEERIQHAGAELTYPVAYSHHFFYQEVDQGQADERREVPYVTGASLAIRRAIVDELGLFDEQFTPFYYEEVDLCYRVAEAGYKVIYVPESIATHHEGFSFEASVEPREWNFQRNRLRFVLKHYSEKQFLDDFIPAELARLKSTPASMNDLIILRQVFLEAHLSLPQIKEERGESMNMVAYRAAFQELLEAVLKIEPEVSSLLTNSVKSEQLRQKGQIDEPSFKSHQPVIGPAIAAFREMWNDVSTKWYVRAIIQQQEAFNDLSTQYMIDQGLQTGAVANDITKLADEIVSLKGQMLELTNSLSALEATISNIEDKIRQENGEQGKEKRRN